MPSVRPSIDDQIAAVGTALEAYPPTLFPETGASLQAALNTLRWVKRHAPTIKNVLGEFEGSKVLPKGEE